MNPDDFNFEDISNEDICEINECQEPQYARHMCRKHYGAWHRSHYFKDPAIGILASLKRQKEEAEIRYKATHGIERMVRRKQDLDEIIIEIANVKKDYKQRKREERYKKLLEE